MIENAEVGSDEVDSKSIETNNHVKPNFSEERNMELSRKDMNTDQLQDIGELDLDQGSDFKSLESNKETSGSGVSNIAYERKQGFEPEGKKEKAESSTKKKRLTLQERLALAARGKKNLESKANSTSGSSSISEISPQKGSHAPVPDPLQNESNKSSNINQFEKQGIQGEVDHNTEMLRLKSEMDHLLKENAKLKDQLSKSSSSNSKKDFDTLRSQIKSKDETIEELRKEGEELSIKEMKLNEVIKKLKQSNKAKDESLLDLAAKNEHIQMELLDLEEVLTHFKLKSAKELSPKFEELTLKLKEVEQELKGIKSLRLDSKVEELEKTLNAETEEKEALSKELNELNIMLEMIKKKHGLDILDKDKTILEITKEKTALSENHNKELRRLEEKIEELRIQNESKITSRAMEGSADNVSNEEDYNMLFEEHKKLQDQYIAFQESWKMKESDLSYRIEALTDEVSSLNKAKAKFQSDFVTLNRNYQHRIEEKNKLNTRISVLEKEKEELNFELELKMADIQALSQKADRLQLAYNNESQKLSIQLANSEKEVQRLKIESQKHKADHDSETLGIGLGFQSRLNRENSSSIELDQDTSNNDSWLDIGLGESSMTPMIKEESNYFDKSINIRGSNFDENDLYNSRTNEVDSIITSKSNKSFGTIPGIIANTAPNSKIQLINKMSANVRRLEIELQSLKEENEKLSKEKEESEKGILDWMHSKEQIKELEAKILSFELKIEEHEKKENTMLDIIGEKSEEVEDLRLDILDLKALCRSQVEQLVELHSGSLRPKNFWCNIITTAYLEIEMGSCKMTNIKTVIDNSNTYLANFISRGDRNEVQFFILKNKSNQISLSSSSTNSEISTDGTITGCCWTSLIETDSSNNRKRQRKPVSSKGDNISEDDAMRPKLIVTLENGLFFVYDPSSNIPIQRISLRETAKCLTPSLIHDSVWSLGKESGLLSEISLTHAKEIKTFKFQDDENINVIKTIRYKSTSSKSQSIAIASDTLFLVDPSKPKKFLLQRFAHTGSKTPFTLIEQSKVVDNILFCCKKSDSNICIYDIKEPENFSTLKCSSDNIMSLFEFIDEASKKAYLMIITEEGIDVFDFAYDSGAFEILPSCVIKTNYHESNAIIFTNLIFEKDQGIFGVWHDGNEPKLTQIPWNSKSVGELIVEIDFTKRDINSEEADVEEIEIPEQAEIKNLKVSKLSRAISLALQSDETSPEEIIELCASNDSENNIKETIMSIFISPGDETLNKLFSTLCAALTSSTAKYPSLNVWLKWLLLIHGSRIASDAAQFENLRALQDLFLEGVELMPKLLGLKGRLQLLKSQAELRNTLGDMDTGSLNEVDIDNKDLNSVESEQEAVAIVDGEMDDFVENGENSGDEPGNPEEDET